MRLRDRIVWGLSLGLLFALPDQASAQIGCEPTGGTTLSATPCKIGEQIQITVSGPANSPFALFGSFDPGPTSTPFGDLCCSTSPAAGFRILINSIQGADPTLDPTGTFVLSPNVPNNTGLLGRSFFLQSATSAGGIELSNSHTLIVGQTGSHQSVVNDLSEARSLHDVTVLSDGRVLIVGGGAGSLVAPEATNSADIYDPRFKDLVATTGMMGFRRALHATVLLPSGRVLVCGGVNSLSVVHDNAEEFDPVTGTFSPVGSMGSPRAGHSASILPDGRVLVVGGTTTFADVGSAFGSALNTAEIYDPVTQLFSTVASTLSEARLLHTATVLLDGDVLVAGGIEDAGLFDLPVLASSGEIFDHVTETFGGAGGQVTSRAAHGAIRLPSGEVLIAGGVNGFTSAISGCELFTPGSGFSSTGSLPLAKAAAMMALLPDGTVLETGGLTGSLVAPSGSVNASIYDPQTGVFTATGSLSQARGAHRMVALTDGTVLSIGGAADDVTVHASVERYYP